MKVITGHLTATDRQAVKQMIAQGLQSANTKRNRYQLWKNGDLYTVTVTKTDRGLIPCPGSQLRESSYTSQFKT